MGLAAHDQQSDPAEIVGRVAADRRDRLLRAYRQRLRPEDLEDCFSQATLELVLRSRRAPFNSAEHVKNALEQKFASRINDRRRALAGRSGIEAALANAISVSDPDSGHLLEDRAASVERQVQAHAELRRLREVIGELSVDQRLVLHSQINLGLDAQEFCSRYGWSSDKFRKVAQRARHKLRTLVHEYHQGARCARLEPDLRALAAGAGTEEQLRRARMHVANCPTCARFVTAVDRASRNAAVLPWPSAFVGAESLARGGWLHAIRRLVHALRPTGTEGRILGAAGVTGGSAVGLVGAKAGVLALCVAGAVGTYALCEPHAAHTRRSAVRVAHTSTRRADAPATRRSTATPRAASSLQTPYRSKIMQIEREFGQRRRLAATRSADSSPPVPVLAGQSSAAVSQETTEFGFER
jgi:DNA-directed RNA polymerase specialized sigma24 family protein